MRMISICHRPLFLHGGTRTCRGIWRFIKLRHDIISLEARTSPGCSCGWVCSACNGQNIYNLDHSGNIIPTVWTRGKATASVNDASAAGACGCPRPENETGCIDCD